MNCKICKMLMTLFSLMLFYDVFSQHLGTLVILLHERSTESKLSHKKAKTKPIHTSGTKSHARIYEELKKSLQRSPTRTELYLECHQHKKEANVMERIKEIVAQQGNRNELR